MIITTSIISMILGISLMISFINADKTINNVDEVSFINLKIELEACALNVVGNTNITRQLSDPYKSKSNLEYRITNYDTNFIIYVKNPNYQDIVYYMVFNNHKCNKEFTELTIFKEGYLYGGINELASKDEEFE